MPRHSHELKDALIKKMMPPMNQSVAAISRESGISKPTLYAWKHDAQSSGLVIPARISSADQWDAKARLAVLMETALMNEAERSVYCREKGLYPEQLDAWKASFEGADAGHTSASKAELALERKRSRALEKELLRKDRALAETAALLTLSKKAQAIWGDAQE